MFDFMIRAINEKNGQAKEERENGIEIMKR